MERTQESSTPGESGARDKVGEEGKLASTLMLMEQGKELKNGESMDVEPQVESPLKAGNMRLSLSSPERCSISRVKPKDKDPNFKGEEVGADNKTRNLYNPIGPFEREIPVEEVQRLISVSASGPSWTSKESTKSRNIRANTFRTWCKPFLPAHFAPTFNLPICLDFLKKDNSEDGPRPRGRPRLHPFTIGLSGYCSAKNDGCPSTFTCGFTETSLAPLLTEHLPESEMIVSNSCVHVKGRDYGQVRGNEREDVIDDYLAAGIKPAAYAKQSLKTVSDDAFNSSNRAAGGITRAAASQISCEAKTKRTRLSGLTGDKLTNVYLAKTMTEDQDCESRSRIDDTSTDLLGIVREFALVPKFSIKLWTKPMLQLYMAIVQTGCAILNSDATGNLVNITGVDELDGKILHTKLVATPRHLVGGEYTKDKTIAKLLSPLTLAECISNKNTGDDVFEFYDQLLRDVRAVYPGRLVPRPLLHLTDCSPALESGALRAFNSGDGKGLTRIEYGNIMLMHLRYYDSILHENAIGSISKERVKELSMSIVDTLYPRVGIFVKECKSHVYLAPGNWLKKKKDNDLANIRVRVNDIVNFTFKRVLELKSISEVIVLMSLVVALFETETFDCPSFSEATKTQDHRGPVELEKEKQFADDVDAFITSETKKLHIASLQDVQDGLDCVERLASNHILVHDEIVGRGKALLKRKCCSYVRSISMDNDDSSQKKANVCLSITFGCSRKDENDGERDDWRQSGMELSVKLPHSAKDGITNPLFCKTVANYLRKYWMTKFSFWAFGVIDLLSMAKDMDIDDNNQAIEGVFRDNKYNQDVYSHVSEPAAYITHRYEDCCLAAKQFAQQHTVINDRIDQLKAKCAKRSDGSLGVKEGVAMASGGTMVPLTSDELTQQEEEAQGEQWSRRGSQGERDSMLRRQLNDIFAHCISEVGGCFLTQQYAFVRKTLGSEKSEGLMTYQTFNNFMKRTTNSKKGMKDKDYRKFQEFINIKRAQQQAVVLSNAQECGGEMEEV